MAARIAAFDWAVTGLGPIDAWPVSLRATVAMVLENRFPMSLLWGPDLLHIYNDAYVPVLGGKHPALGQSARLLWPEIWPIVGPQIEGALEGRGSTWNEHLLLPLVRKGFREESYFTVAYGPVRDDAGTIGGVLITCQETTVQVQDERQLQMLRELGAEGVAADSAEAACRTAAHVLAKNDADVPFALLYLIRPGDGEAELVASAGLEGTLEAAPKHLAWRRPGQAWPLAETRDEGGFLLLEDLPSRFGRLPSGRWEETPQRAVILCLTASGQAEPYGFLVAGLSPMRPLDERYRRMFRLTADQIVSSISGARAFEEEHRRVEALAMLDRAKTTFFSNVSHEFRTPLTLMIGPAEDLMAGVHGPLPPRQRAQVDLIQRNAKRMHKLVNTLLNVTRLEAGRLQPSFEPLDLSTLTRELARSFHGAIERAGLDQEVRCADLGEPVFVDRDMWEQIVLNLVSNALKFTFEGKITVSLALEGADVVLRVADTGVGIAPESLPQLFDRFFRAEGGRARTAEGSGIGLALVHDMVRVHKGTIDVSTAPGQGTTFAVRIPRGSKHLPQDRLAAAPVGPTSARAAVPFVEEALGWLQPAEGAGDDAELAGLAAAAFPESPTARILIADDNADMRNYLRHVLESRFDVEVVADGEAALAAIEAHPPDLVLTDVMMGAVDGIELLRRLRARPQTKALPVVMVSARTGEEAKVEGLRAGADEYLTKPFSARELLARVDTQLKLARLRAAAEHDRERFFALLQQAPVPIVVYEGAELRLAFQNEAAWAITGGPLATGKDFLEIFPELEGRPSHVLLRQVFQTGKPAIGHALPVRVRGVGNGTNERIFDFIRQPMKDAEGRMVGVIGVAFEVTDAVRARREIEQSEARFRTIFEMADVSIWEEDFSEVKRYCDRLRSIHGEGLREALHANPGLVAGALRLIRVRDVNPATVRMFGAKTKEQLFEGIASIFLPKTFDAFIDEIVALAEGKRVYVAETPLRTLDGKQLDVVFSLGIPEEARDYERALITITDLSGHKSAEREREARIVEMERAVRFGEMFAGMLGHDLRNPLSAIMTAAELIARRAATAEMEKIEGPAKRVISSAQRMARMISQLLDFTRIRLGGGLPLERTHVDLAEVTRAIIDELEPVYACPMRLTCTGDVAGTWDRDRLSQMVSNLAANACQHGTEGFPIELILDGSQPGSVRLEVRNQGVVPPALLPFVFEPLRQANDTGPRVGPSSGLGLGLYITQQIALGHGGTIRVESDEANGTRFVVVLPRDLTPPAAPAAAAG
jgi:signal transduction histidine kinase/FixJ family two-component response regulator